MTVYPATRSVVLVTLAAAAASAGAADWRITPVASSGIGYVDNPRLIPHSDEAYTNYRAEFSAPMSFDDGRTNISLDPRLVIASYPQDSLLDRNDKYVTLSAQRSYETAIWAGSASFVRDTTLTSELGLTGLQEVNRPHEALSLTATPTLLLSDRMQLGAQLYWSDNNYKDAEFTGLVDYRYSLGAASANYVWTEKVKLSMQASLGRLEVPAYGTRSDTINVTAALAWQYSELWSAQLSVGPSRVESEIGNDQGYVYSASVKRRGLRSGISALVARDVTPTGRGVLVTRDQATLSTQYSLTERLSWTVAAEFSRTTDTVSGLAAGRQRIEYSSVDTSLRWQMTPNWSALLSVNGRTQDYDSRRDPASGSSVAIGLLWQGGPRAWSR
jgi:hypothetical protein